MLYYKNTGFYLFAIESLITLTLFINYRKEKTMSLTEEKIVKKCSKLLKYLTEESYSFI